MKEFQFIGHCPVCNAKYRPDTAALVEKTQDLLSFLVECSRCNSSVILLVTGKVRGIVTTIGMLTDLTVEDLPLLKLKTPISLDDVLEMHRHLERASQGNVT